MPLNQQELELCKKLGECWNDFSQLRELHPMDKQEFCKIIHEAQNMVMARSAVREHSIEFKISK